MPQISPAARSLARRALLHEAGGRAEPAALAEAADRADARLRERLADLIGTTGYTALVARAVRLAQAEVPALKGVTVDAGVEGSLHGVRALALTSDDPTVAEAGVTALLAHVIGLLSTFIGEDLALRLVRDAWPDFAHDQVSTGGAHE